MQVRRVDYLVYAAHAGFWLVFAVASRMRRRGQPGNDNPVSNAKRTAAHSRLLVGIHFAAFAVINWGIGQALFGGGVPRLFSGQRIVGALVIAAGALLSASAVLYFRSWRFRAAVNTGHQLATGGPFSVLRHPIYMGLNLLALGTAIWIPTPIIWSGAALMIIGGDLRARAEEKLLIEVFGSDYVAYMKKTWRCVPGIY